MAKREIGCHVKMSFVVYLCNIDDECTTDIEKGEHNEIDICV